MTPLTQQQADAFYSAFPSAKRDELMSRHTYLKIGGPAALFVSIENADDLVRAVQTAKKHAIPFAVIGGGSNLLVADEGYRGVVIEAAFRSATVEGERLKADAGAFTVRVSKMASEAGLVGFEWGSGVPGTIGGAVYGNAGCFGGEMCDAVESVDAYDVTNDRRVTYANADCRFAYRESRFKHEPHVILSATLKLAIGDKLASMAKLEVISAKRKDTQPQGAFSAGCLFKNYEYHDDNALQIAERHLEIPAQMKSQKRIAAGWLIDQAGLKGTTVGKAQVSLVHGNFLVNLGGARAQDVIALSSLVKMKIRDAYGIMLQDEVQLLGF